MSDDLTDGVDEWVDHLDSCIDCEMGFICDVGRAIIESVKSGKRHAFGHWLKRHIEKRLNEREQPQPYEDDEEEPPTLFGYPVVMMPSGPHLIEQKLDDPPLSEVNIFLKHCPMHFPLGTHSLTSIKGLKVGMAITEHDTPEQGEQAWRYCNSNKEAREVYDQMKARLLEQDYTVIYCGERNEG